MSKITIVVVDDHPLFRQGVVDSFSLEPDLLVVGQAADGEEGLSLIQALRPQVAVLDVNLPGMNGQQLMRRIVADKIPTRVILLTAYTDDDQIIQAMLGGAAAHCSKEVHPEELVQVIRHVVEGRYVLRDQVFDQPAMERWIAAKADGQSRLSGEPGETVYPLSAREMEVLACVTRGLSNKEIASLLGISHQTVKNHVTAILRKIGVEDRTQAAVYALRRGWVRLYQSET